MENGAIPDGHVSASSQWNANHAARQGRLNFQAVPGKAGSWSARRNDANQWLQIDLANEFTRVTLVATQGRNGYSQWVTKYKLQYSNDGVNFQYYREYRQLMDKVNIIDLCPQRQKKSIYSTSLFFVFPFFLACSTNKTDLKTSLLAGFGGYEY